MSIQLPEPIFRQFAEIAEQTHQPIETLVAQSVIHLQTPGTDHSTNRSPMHTITPELWQFSRLH